MRTIDKLWLAVVALVALGCAAAGCGGGAALAAPAAASASTEVAGGCGAALSAPVASVWRDLGGESGRLGCPTGGESAGAPSPQHSASRVATFGQKGVIVLAVSGPRAGQAYAVSGCFYRLYVQFGSTDGWLGLPIADQETTPDGSRQTFEGGIVRYDRALDECEAEPTAPQAAADTTEAPVESLAPLDVFENTTTGDRISLAAAGSVAQVTASGYQRLRGQARVMTEEARGAIRLKLYANEDAGVHETLASAQSERDALALGMAFQASQGWVWIDPHPGTVALKLYREPTAGRTRLTAGPQDEQDATAAGYTFVRVEGYAAPAS